MPVPNATFNAGTPVFLSASVQDTTPSPVPISQDDFPLRGEPESLRQAGHLKVSVSMPRHREWTERTAKRFKTLAAAEALERLSEEEAKELAELDRLREAHFASESASELLHAMQARRRLDDLLRALERYVDFQNAATKGQKR